MLNRLRVRWALAAAALLTAGCIASDASELPAGPGGAPPSPTTLRIAYLAPAPPDDPSYAPAFSAASIALRVASADGPPSAPIEAGIEWIEIPTVGDELRSVLEGYDAAIIAAGVPRRSVEALASAAATVGVPAASLSGGPPEDLYVLAPGRGGLAEAMVDLGDSDACIAWGEGGEGVERALRKSVGGASSPFDPVAVGDDESSAAIAAAELLDRGCGTVLWAGPGGIGGEVLASLVSSDLPDPLFVGTDSLRDGYFVEAAGPAAEGAVVVSGARDVSTRLRLEVRRFIQDYQAEVGSPPQPFAVEGWDAANLLVQVLRGEPPRGGIWEGLGGTYAFGPGALPPTFVYVLEDGRWMLQGS